MKSKCQNSLLNLTFIAFIWSVALSSQAFATQVKCNRVALRQLAIPQGYVTSGQLRVDNGEIKLFGSGPGNTYQKKGDQIQITRKIIGPQSIEKPQKIEIKLNQRKVSEMTIVLDKEKSQVTLDDDCNLQSVIVNDRDVQFDRVLCEKVRTLLRRQGKDESALKACSSLSNQLNEIISNRETEIEKNSNNKLKLAIQKNEVLGLPFQSVLSCGDQFYFEKNFDIWSAKAVNYSAEWLTEAFGKDSDKASSESKASSGTLPGAR